MNKEQKIRYFKCIYNGSEFGRYSGRTPKQAASKAFTAIIKNNGGSNNCINNNYSFLLRECTRGFKSKEKEYEGKRIKLDNPICIKIKSENNDKNIKYQYLNKVKYIPLKL